MAKGKFVVATLVMFCVVFAGVTAAIKFNDWSKNAKSVFTHSQKVPQDYLQDAKLDAATNNSADFRAASKKILQSVVSIDTQVEGENFFGEHVVQNAGAGSGVVITKDGYIVTNNHVVRVNVGFNESQLVDKVRITFSDGRTAQAKIVGTDPRADLAVLKVDLQNLIPIETGDSSKLEVGQWVIAVGNPLGYENTLSVGVVSNIGRQLPGSSDAVFIDGIQTDAAINPGNSGGALCDADGELVGINSSIASTTRANIGIGFAIPVNRMKQVVDDIIKFGYAKYGQPGITVLRRPGVLGVPEARAQLKQQVSAPTEPPSEGAVVLEVQPGSAAMQSGVKYLDVITEVNGKKVEDFEDYFKVMSPLRPGTEVNFKLWSAGQMKSVKVVLADAGKARI